MENTPKIGCVVMAAGNARRFGDNKLAAQLRGRSLILRALEAVPAEKFDKVVVVTQYPEVMRDAIEFGSTICGTPLPPTPWPTGWTLRPSPPSWAMCPVPPR